MPLCYLDRAWCSASLSGAGEARCVNAECGRCLTQEHSERARKADLGISVSPYRRDGCGYAPAVDEIAERGFSGREML